MTVSAAGTLEYTYSGNGVTTSFSFPVRFLEKAEVIVALREDDVDTVQTLTTHYTIAGTSWPTGANIVFVTAPTADQTVVLRRQTIAKQVVDLATAARVDAESVELQMDRLTLAQQDQGARLDRALLVPIGSDADASDLSAAILVAAENIEAIQDAPVEAAAAAASATAAATSASAASTSATNAATSATAAQTAKTNAETAETNAETAATNASTSATNAATSATNAATSETNAGNSATAAAASATAADASADAAAASAATLTYASQAEAEAGTVDNRIINPLRLTQKLKKDGFLSIYQFGSTVTDTTIDTALAEGLPILFPTGDYDIGEPMVLRDFSGIIGHGENTRFIRQFTGGAMITDEAADALLPVRLEHFQITTDASVTAASGDDGVKLNSDNTGWSQRGSVNNLRIEKQYDGFSWTRGSDGTFFGIFCQLNERHGFVGANPRGHFLRCQANANKSSGWVINYSEAGETGLDLDLCRSFANQDYGFNVINTGGVVGANLNLHRVVASYDGKGGIQIIAPMTQLLITDPLTEYAGFVADHIPAYTGDTSAFGLYINAAITKATVNGLKTLNNKGAGARLYEAEIDLRDTYIANNGRGGVDAAGLELGDSVIINGSGLRFDDDTATQTDISIVDDTVTGYLDGVTAESIFGSTTSRTLRITNMNGGLGGIVTLASAATPALPNYGAVFSVTGTTTITALPAVWTGRRISLVFAAALTLTHGNNLNLGASITTYAGLTVELEYDGTNWNLIGRNTPVAEGVWTPTATLVANVDAAVPNEAHWYRIGNQVHCYGNLTIDPTAGSVLIEIGLSLPIASAFTSGRDLRGWLSNDGGNLSGVVIADATNDRANIRVMSPGTTNDGYSYGFDYTVM